jgi:hypothetical protein
VTGSVIKLNCKGETARGLGEAGLLIWFGGGVGFWVGRWMYGVLAAIDARLAYSRSKGASSGSSAER